MPFSSPPQIISVVGPTASGKTKLGVALALALNGEVVSADSMQIYRRMNIGTAKPTPQEQLGIPHYMLDVADPSENYSVARYVRDASPIVDDILARGKLPILVGGTGLYVDSLLSGRSFAVRSSGWRQRLQQRLHAEGITPLLNELQQIDPETASRLHPADQKRILRALEVWHETGQTISEHNRLSRLQPPRYQSVTIALNFTQRQDLWSRINLRVDEMLRLGLCDEVQALLDSGIPPDCTAMQAIGYKEVAAALRGECSLPDAVEEVKLRTRQYAKRQLTWFRRNPSAHWFLWDQSPDFSAALRFSETLFYQNKTP